MLVCSELVGADYLWQIDEMSHEDCEDYVNQGHWGKRRDVQYEE